MSFIDQITALQGPAIRSGVHDKSLQRKQFAIKDSIALGNEVLREISSNRQMLSNVELAGVISWTTVMVTDIIQDAVKVEPTGRAKMVLFILDKAKGQLPDKFAGNRYKNELKAIDTTVKVLTAAHPRLGDLAKVFGNMAKNTYGLMDFAQSSKDAKAGNEQQKKTMEASLRKMLEKLKEIECRIYDDARSDDGQSGKSATVRQSTQLPKARLP